MKCDKALQEEGKCTFRLINSYLTSRYNDGVVCMPQTLNRLQSLTQRTNPAPGSLSFTPLWQLAGASWPEQESCGTENPLEGQKNMQEFGQKACHSATCHIAACPAEQGTWPAWQSWSSPETKPCQEKNPVIPEAPRGREELRQGKTLGKSSNKVTAKFIAPLGYAFFLP